MSYVTVTYGVMGQVLGYNTDSGSQMQFKNSIEAAQVTLDALSSALLAMRSISQALGVDVSKFDKTQMLSTDTSTTQSSSSTDTTTINSTTATTDSSTATTK